MKEKIDRGFAEKFVAEGLTFDDVLLIPLQRGLPGDVDTSTWLTKRID